MTGASPKLTRVQRELYAEIVRLQAQHAADRLSIKVGAYRTWVLPQAAVGNKESVFRALQDKGRIDIHNHGPGSYSVSQRRL